MDVRLFRLFVGFIFPSQRDHRIASGPKVPQQKDIDNYLIQLEGTGANAIFGVSIAVAEAGAGEKVRLEHRSLLRSSHSTRRILTVLRLTLRIYLHTVTSLILLASSLHSSSSQ
jgi:hypothetical protein